MGIKLDELIESTELNANDIMHLRTVDGLDKKIAVNNMPAADLAGEGRTTETIKDNANDIDTNAGDIVDVAAAAAAAISDLAGVGRTNETVKNNKDLIDALGGAPAGVILPFGGTAAPDDYLLCDGSSLLRASYASLFTAIGTAYGTADGTHFNVPDLRGYFLRGRANGQTTDPDRAARTALKAGGNTGDNVGSKQLDAFQGHRFGIGQASSFVSGGGSHPAFMTEGASPTRWTWGAIGDGTHGTPRIARESRPKNVYVNYIIKY